MILCKPIILLIYMINITLLNICNNIFILSVHYKLFLINNNFKIKYLFTKTYLKTKDDLCL